MAAAWPSEWGAEQTEAWVRSELARAGPANLDSSKFSIPGKTLLKFSEKDFASLVGDANAGKRLFEALQRVPKGPAAAQPQVAPSASQQPRKQMPVAARQPPKQSQKDLLASLGSVMDFSVPAAEIKPTTKPLAQAKMVNPYETLPGLLGDSSVKAAPIRKPQPQASVPVAAAAASIAQLPTVAQMPVAAAPLPVKPKLSAAARPFVPVSSAAAAAAPPPAALSVALPMDLTEDEAVVVEQQVAAVRQRGGVAALEGDEFAELRRSDVAASLMDEAPDAPTLRVLVLDTNFLLSHLRWVEQLLVRMQGRHFVVVVPWVVLTELDRLKRGPDGGEVKERSHSAVAAAAASPSAEQREMEERLAELEELEAVEAAEELENDNVVRQMRALDMFEEYSERARFYAQRGGVPEEEWDDGEYYYGDEGDDAAAWAAEGGGGDMDEAEDAHGEQQSEVKQASGGARAPEERAGQTVHAEAESHDVGYLARAAIRYLHERFEAADGVLRGQRMGEVHAKEGAALEELRSSNDNRVLDCCLFFQDAGRGRERPVWLLSNDRNLAVKALAHKVRVLGWDKVQSVSRGDAVATVDALEKGQL